MESSENKVIPFQSNRNILNKKEETILENNQGNGNVKNENVKNDNPSSNSSGAKSFFASKKGIILLSVLGVVAVAAVVVAVIATQVNKNKENDQSENINHHSHAYGNLDEEVFDDEVDDDENIILEEDITGQYRSDLNNEQIFISPFSSLTKNNQIKFTISQGETISVLAVGQLQNAEISSIIPTY